MNALPIVSRFARVVGLVVVALVLVAPFAIAAAFVGASVA